jgi:hypothetical protein
MTDAIRVEDLKELLAPGNQKHLGREAFVLEQQLDNFGANGWQLVAVAGRPTDRAYYFTRGSTRCADR